MKNTLHFLSVILFLLNVQGIWAQSTALHSSIEALNLQPVCEGEATTIELETSDNSLTFQWEVREDRYFHPIETGDTRFSGANTAVLDIAAADAQMDFRCIISNGTASLETDPIRLQTKNPVIRRQPADKIAYLNDNFSMTTVVTGTFLTYQWQMLNNGSWSDLENSKEFKGTNQPTLIIRKITNDYEGKALRCVVTGGDCGGTETIISAAGTITVSSQISPLKSVSNNPNTVIWYSNQQKTYINGNPTIFVDGTIQTTGKIVNDPVTANYFFLAQDGNDMYVTGNVINDGFDDDTNPNHIQNENTYLFHPVADKTKLIFTGSADSEISGTSDLTTIYHLKTEKTSNTNQVTLQQDIHVRSQVEFGTGDVNLNGQELELDFTPSDVVNQNVQPTLTPATASEFPVLLNETEDNRITDSAPSLTTGGVHVIQLLDNDFGNNSVSPFASGYDFGNIGFEITANGAGGATTSFAADQVDIFRRLLPLSVTSSVTGIDRFYLFNKQNDALATDEFGVKLGYLDNDLSQGEDEDGLSVYFNETNTIPFDNYPPTAIDTGADEVTVDMVDAIEGYFTLAECPDTPEITFNATSTDVCWDELATITVNLNGGTAATYEWFLDGNLTNQTGASFEITGSPDSTATQNLFLVVTSDFGCRATLSHTINHLQTPFVDLGDDSFLCENQSITLNAQNALPGTTYLWTVDGATASTQQTYEYFASGATNPVEIIVAVTNSVGCTRLDTIFVTEAVSPAVDLGGDQTVCESGTTITLDATPTNIITGDAFDYDWSTTEATAIINPPVTATNSVYSVTVTNTVTSCSSVANMTALLSEISLSTTQTNVACFGESTGAIDLTATSTESTATFNYNWSNNETTEDLNNLAAGSYDVTVTDNFGCTETLDLPVNITQPSAPLAATPVATDVTCNGGNDGLISSNPSGGTAPYTFLWSNSATSQDINLLTAGTYTVTITDANGCTAVATQTVAEPTAITATLTVTDVVCNGDATGAIDLSASGGTPGYTYAWSNATTNEDLNNVVAGTYFVTITDANNCTAVFSETINENPAITFDVETVVNVSCNGAGDGSITLDNTTTGTAGFTFSWAGQNTGATAFGNPINNLAPDTYDVTVTNSNNCTTTFMYTITEPAILEVSNVSIVNSDGCVDNGAIDITVIGGTIPYTYLWSNGATTQDIGNLSGGNYDVTITDANGCTAIETYLVTAPNGLMLTETQVNVSCNGAADGSLDVMVTGGESPYTYAWTLANGGTASTPDIDNLIPGNYQLVVTDNLGCTASNTYTITQPDVLVVGGTETNVSCNGFGDGSIQTTVMGGTTPYAYQWSANANNATTADVDNLSPDTYSVTVTDANGCSETQSFIITEPTILAANPIIVSDLDCFNDTDAVVGAGASGGTMPYSYQWDGGPNTEFYSNVGGGTYEVTVTDANGCTVSNTVTVVPPTQINIALTNQTNVSIFGGLDGAINISVSGGVPGSNPAYTFDWTNGAGTSIASTEDVDNLSADTYTVVVTDGNGCTETDMFTITEPDLLEVALDNSTNVSCNGGSDGTIEVTVMGGVSPYTYAWSTAANSSYSSSEDLTGLPADTYALLVTDANGATATLMPDVLISEPAILTASATPFDVLCNGGNDGSISITANGGTPPYSYNWSNGAPDNSQNSGLIAGTYDVTITDSNGCTTEVNNIAVNEPTMMMLSGVVTDATVFGGSDGAIDLTVTGGTSPYMFDWDNDNTIGDSDPEDINGLTEGTYTVVVTDNNGCTATMSFTVNQPPALTITLDAANDPLCNGEATGNIEITVMGGVTPYTYQWDNGATSEDLLNITAGTYNLTVTDDNGNVQTFNMTLNEPDALASTANTTDISCFNGNDGSIQVTVTGGTAPYNYAWSNNATTSGITNLTAGNYDLTITDNQNCQLIQNYTLNEPTDIAISGVETAVTIFGGNDGAIDITVTDGTPGYTYLWSNNATTEDINNLTAGTYTVTVTDANLCEKTATFTITEPTQLEVILTSSTNISCNGFADGAIDITASGAVPPYTYLWSNGSTMEDLMNLAPDTYQVTVTDANGATASLANAVIITEPTVLADNPATITNVSCNGGSDGNITMNPTGGTPPYSFNWDNGLGTNIAINDLTAGDYTVTITDDNGCTIVRTNTVTEPPVLTVSGVVTDVTIFGEATGSIDITAAGGTPAYTYLWSNGATTEDISNLTAGTYDVTVTDANNCTVTDTYTVTEPAELLIATNTAIDPTCNGFADGSASVAVTGGVTPYTYDWDNDGIGDNDDSEAITGLTVGTYNLTVTDANGAVATHSVTLSEPTVLTSSETFQDASCNAGNDGTITITGNGGTAPYSILWNTGATTMTINGLTAGTYSYTLTDAQNCEVTNAVTIGEPTALAETATVQDANCDGFSDGMITLTASGGTAAYTYLWDNGETTATIDNLAAGTYTITITDAQSCILTATYTVNQPSAITITEINNVDANCGQSDGTVTVAASGGTAPYSYQWVNPAVADSTLTGVPAGVYEMIVTDAQGCTQLQAFTVNDLNGPTLTLVSQTDVDCFGQNTGAITTAVTDGTPPFNYLWSNGETTANLSNLVAGIYSLTLTDAVGCVATLTTEVLENMELSLILVPTDISCYQGQDGAVSSFANGGVTPYTYSWSNGETTQDIMNLPIGTYAVTVTDDVGCTIVDSLTLNEPTEITYTEMVTPVSCFGGMDGEIQLNFNGGTPPFTYQWSTGATTSNISNLATGDYSVTVADDNNCTTELTINVPEPLEILLSLTIENSDCFGDNSGSVAVAVDNTNSNNLLYTLQLTNGGPLIQQVNDPVFNNLAPEDYSMQVLELTGNQCNSDYEYFTITESPELTVNSTNTPVSCNEGTDGTISVSVQGGTPDYTIDWNNGANETTISNLAAGIYIATITDALGCTMVTTDTIVEPDAILIAATIDSISCEGTFDGEITLTVSGGSGNYTYAWSTGQNANIIDNLGAGTYEVIVSDASNSACVADTTFTLNEPTVVEITNAVITEASCGGAATGSIDITVGGGTLPYTFAWTDDTGTNVAMTEDLMNSNSGDFTVIITDANGCTATESYFIDSQATVQVSMSTIDVSCFGLVDGEATLTVTGGSGSYTFDWAGVANPNDQNQTNLAAGDYAVTVNDANGSCEQILTVTINEPAEIVVSNQMVTNISCAGAATGGFSFTVSGGPTGNFVFDWSNTDGTFTDQTLVPELNNLPPGTYTVTASDSPCSFTEEFTINETDVLAATVEVEVADCSSTVTVTATGGATPYTYNISPDPNGNSGSNNVFNGLPANTYTLTVVDANGCEIMEMFDVDDNDDISVMSNVTDITCAGAMDGAIEITSNDPNLAFNWSNGAGNINSINNLAAGNYDVTITNDAGCTEELTFALTDPQAIVIDTMSFVSEICFGNDNGEITIGITGGNNPSIAWSNGVMNQNSISGLAAGNYTVTVGENGCEVMANFDITSNPEITINLVTSTEPTCGQQNGYLEINASGDNPSAYTYQWSGGVPNDLAFIDNLGAGDYAVTVTDGNMCTAEAMFTLNAPNALTASAMATNVTCLGANDGFITITASGGIGTLTSSIDGTNYQASNEFTGLSGGSYTATVQDDDGCTFTAGTFDITEPTEQLVATASTTPSSGIGVADGAIDLMVTGGEMPYSFNWSNGLTTEDIAGLVEGDYIVTITDNRGCELVETFTIIVSNTGVLTISTNLTDISCFDANDGELEVIIDGGTPPYSITWTYPDNSMVFDQMIIQNLGPGSYDVSVSDANGLLQSETMLVLTNPQELTGSVTAVDACAGQTDGVLVFNINGGTLPFTYEYTVGGTPISMMDNDVEIDSIQNLAPDTYTNISVTDANGCSLLLTDQTIGETPGISITVDMQNNVSCNGLMDGFIGISATGGNVLGGYNYIWTDEAGAQIGTVNNIGNLTAGIYTIVVTDDTGCTGTETITISEPTQIEANTTTTDIPCFGDATGSISISGFTGGSGSGYTWIWDDGSIDVNDRTNLSEGNYSLTVTDGNGCTKTVDFDLAQPATALNFEFAVENEICFEENNGFISVITSGGTAPYTFNWSNGETTEDVFDLAPGDYQLTITDDNGCTVTLDTTVLAAEELIVNFTTTDPTCFGFNDGAIDLTVSGGVPDYNFDWGGTFSEDLNNLSGGDYSVTITYNNDLCEHIEDVQLVEPVEMTIAPQTDSVSCKGSSDGTISLNATGGTGMLSYSWNTGATTDMLDNLAAGTYGVTVTDENNCMVDFTDTVGEPDLLVVTANIQRAGCKSADDGSIILDIEGGTAPFTFDWSNGSTDSATVNLVTSNYQVTVFDANDCMVEQDLLVAEADTVFTAKFLAASGLADVDSVEVNADDQIHFRDVSFPNPIEWKWSFGDDVGSMSTEANPVFSYVNNAAENESAYTTKLIVSNQFCIDSLEKVIRITNNLRIKAPKQDSIIYLEFTEMTAFPNPTNGIINVNIEMTRAEEVKLTVFDAVGKFYHEETLQGDDRYETMIDVQALPEGMYFIRAKALNRVHTLKIVVYK